jgi:hypothetical protein
VVYLYEELQRIARQPGFSGIKDEVTIVVDRQDGKPSNFDVEVRAWGVHLSWVAIRWWWRWWWWLGKKEAWLG